MEDKSKQLAIDYGVTFNAGPASARVLHDILEFCKIFGPVYDPSPNTMYFNEGVRSVGLYIMQAMHMTPGQLQDIIDSSLSSDQEEQPSSAIDEESDDES